MPTEPIAEAHHKLVRDVSGLRLDRASAEQIDALGLHLTHVSWEDTARFKDSAVGPNISDMTNSAGQRAPFTGARASESLSPGTGGQAAARASAVLLIQVPAEAGSAAAGPL